MIDNEWGFSSYPLVAGHEVIGRVVALGSAAQDKGLKVGQRVGIGWTARSCGHCDACISGNQINCLEGAVPTILNKGGFADKLRAPVRVFHFATQPRRFALIVIGNAFDRAAIGIQCHKGIHH